MIARNSSKFLFRCPTLEQKSEKNDNVIQLD